MEVDWAINKLSCSDLLVPKENLLAMGRLYLTWCHGQPISLFNPDTFLESLTFRDLELILALQTLSLRYPPSTLTPQKRERLDSMEKEARSAVMSRIASSEAELSTLQTLCILSMVEFAGKSKYRAKFYTGSYQLLTHVLLQTARLLRQDCT